MIMDMRYYPREFVTQFIKIYEGHPSLWNMSVPEYRNKKKKDEAYTALLGFVRQYDKTTTICDIKRKINTIRASYRKEKRKVKESLTSGNDGDVHTPKLWYYDMLSFLEEMVGQESNPNISTPTMSTKEEDESTEFESVSQGEFVEEWEERSSTPVSIASPSPQQNERKRRHKEAHEQSNLINDRLISWAEEDEFDTLGKTFATKLRNIAKQSRLKFGIADKLINEILFHAEYGEISMSTVIVNPPPNENH